jgi:hypothetical protein
MQNQTSRRTIIKAALSFVAVALFAGLGLAHGGFEHVRGTVTKVSADSVTVETAEKTSVDVGLNAKTTYARGTKAVKAADMKVGDRVVIDATKHEEKLVAASIKLGGAAEKAAAHEHEAEHEGHDAAPAGHDHH